MMCDLTIFNASYAGHTHDSILFESDHALTPFMPSTV